MYTIGDFLIKLKNAYMVGKKTIEYPHSNAVFAIGKILEDERYIQKLKIKSEKLEAKPERRFLEIELKYKKKLPAISEIKLVSKPSIHHYVKKSNLLRTTAAHGIGIVSTSKGIMTHKKAQKIGFGGKLICQIY